MIESSARVVSLVPSWTETLLWAHIHVVGRTRFCIHPQQQIEKIPTVGGTKGFDLEKILALKPDFVILDREENKKEMADQLKQASVQILVSHVDSFESAAAFLNEVGVKLNSDLLKQLSHRYLRVSESMSKFNRDKFLQLIHIEGDWARLNLNEIQYVIWKNPYMVIGQKTFIAEVLKCAGLIVNSEEKYPVITTKNLIANSCLLSSEPYPFQKEFHQMLSEGFKAVLVDGEKLSWYGIRNLIFLEECLK